MDEFHITIREGWDQYLSLAELSVLTRTRPETILTFVEYGLIEPVPDVDAGASTEPFFMLNAIHRVRTIRRLRSDMGVNLAGIAVILELLDKINRLQAEVERLR